MSEINERQDKQRDGNTDRALNETINIRRADVVTTASQEWGWYITGLTQGTAHWQQSGNVRHTLEFFAGSQPAEMRGALIFEQMLKNAHKSAKRQKKFKVQTLRREK